MSRKLGLLSIAILLLPIAFAMTRPNVKAVDPCKLYIDPPAVIDQALIPTSTFNITVKVDNIPTDPGLVGIEFNITWNPGLLNGVAMQEIMFHEVTPPDQWDNIWQLKRIVANNSVYYAFTFQDISAALSGGYAPISGSHIVANITLRVVGTGEYALHFYKSNLGNTIGGSIAHDTVDGFFSNLPPPQTYLVVRGVDNDVWYRSFDGSSWSSWIGVGGQTYDTPAAAVLNGKLHIVVKGTDGGLWWGVVDLSHNSFSGWNGMSGQGVPTLTSTGSALHLVVRGADDSVWYRSFDGSSWSSWIGVGGQTYDTPAAAVLNGKLHIVANGTDGKLWWLVVDLSDNSFSRWTEMWGQGTPTLTTSSTGLYLVARGSDDVVWYRSFDGSTWSNWIGVGGHTLDTPAAAVLDGKLCIVVNGTDGSLWWSVADLSDYSFSGWGGLSGQGIPTLTNIN